MYKKTLHYLTHLEESDITHFKQFVEIQNFTRGCIF